MAGYEFVSVGSDSVHVLNSSGQVQTCTVVCTVGCFKNLQDSMIYQLDTTYARRCLQNCIPAMFIKQSFFGAFRAPLAVKFQENGNKT
jgi:hypothetical protein